MRRDLYNETIRLENSHWWFISRRKIIETFLANSLKKNLESVLDIGSGTGANFLVLKKFFNKLSGIEKSDIARSYSQERFPDIAIFKGTFSDFKAESLFNAISFFDVLEHIDEEEKTLLQTHSLLKDGGEIIITVPAYMFMWSEHDDIAHHKRRYTKKRLIHVLEKTGFKINRISYFNTFLFLPILLFRLVEKFLGLGKNSSDFSKTPTFLDTVLASIFSLERYLIRFMNLPFGVSLICIASKKRVSKEIIRIS